MSLSFRIVLAVVFCSVTATVSVAQEAQEAPSAEQRQLETSDRRIAKFLAGAATALVLHEAGHAAIGWHRTQLAPRRGYAATTAGFWVQYLVSEHLLAHDIPLRTERAPFKKGLFAFHVLTSTGYAALAFARTGPPGRDTLGMANTLRINERWIGAMVLAPAVFDTIRYFHPDARWAAWMSRGVEIGSVALVVR